MKRQRPPWGRSAAACLVAALLGGCPVKEATPVDVGPAAEFQVLARDHVLGAKDAPVTVIEYGDFECPICGLFVANTFPAIRANYIDTNRVRWVFRHLPLQKHVHAYAAAEASECAAAQGRFWDYHDVLLANQFTLTTNDLERFASQLGLDTGVFSACLTTGAEAARVDADLASAAALDVNHTPTFFIGQQRVIGLLTVEEFSAVLDAALATASNTQP